MTPGIAAAGRFSSRCSPFANWDLCVNGGPLTQGRFNIEYPADHLEPFAHSEKTQTLSRFGQPNTVHGKAFAVVGDLHANRPWEFLNGDLDLAGVSMPGDIREGFL